jgi:hypothetical protein
MADRFSNTSGPPPGHQPTASAPAPAPPPVPPAPHAPPAPPAPPVLFGPLPPVGVFFTHYLPPVARTVGRNTAGPMLPAPGQIGCDYVPCTYPASKGTDAGPGTVKCKAHKLCRHKAHRLCIGGRKTWICASCQLRRAARPGCQRRPAPPPPPRVRRQRDAKTQAAARIAQQFQSSGAVLEECSKPLL